MHELAIAQRLIESSVALLPQGTTRITKLHVQLGTLAGVSEEELRFGFEVMSADTVCAGATLEITNLPAIAHCPQCGIEFSVINSDGQICPTCGSPAIVVLQGKELVVTSLEATGEAVHG